MKRILQRGDDFNSSLQSTGKGQFKEAAPHEQPNVASSAGIGLSASQPSALAARSKAGKGVASGADFSFAAGNAGGAMYMPEVGFPADHVRDDAAEAGFVRRDDAESITQPMMQELGAHLKRRAKRASDGVWASAKEKLRDDAGHFKKGIPEQEISDGQYEDKGALQKVVQELLGMQPISLTEKICVKQLRDIADLETMKQSAGYRALKEALHREVSVWRDTILLKMVTKSVESKQMAERIAECVDKGAVAGNSGSISLPSHATLQDMLQDKMRAWLTDNVAAKIRMAFAEETLPQARTAFERALEDVVEQISEVALMQGLEARKGVGADEFFEICRLEVAAAIRRQVKVWDATMNTGSGGNNGNKLPGGTNPPGGTDPPDGYRDISTILRTLSKPLWQDLDAVEKDVALAASCIHSAKDSASFVEACRFGGFNARLAAAKTAVLTAVSGGRIREAFATALSWDMQNLSCPCLTEYVCDRLVDEVFSEDGLQPADLLARGDVSSALDMESKCKMMVVLVYCIGREDTSLIRLTSNVEWLFGVLQHVVGSSDPVSLNVLEPHASFIFSTLEAFSSNEVPMSVLQAEEGQRKHLLRTTKTALKHLQVLIGGSKK